jgi:protein gp37
MGKTTIQWTDYSWPVVNGCRRVSAGCTNCYAERLTATRLSKQPKYAGLAVYGEHGPRWTGQTRLWVPHLDMPLRLRKPSRIFVADMGDLFYEGVKDQDIAAVFGIMAACPQHTFQVLTKRPERVRQWLKRVAAESRARHLTETGWVNTYALLFLAGVDHKLLERYETRRDWPLSNVWLGVSVEDQKTADERIPLLLGAPAAVRFISYEPALGPVDFERVQWPGKHQVDVLRGGAWNAPGCPGGFTQHSDMQTIDWVIVGGESGPGARAFDLAWADRTVTQCAAAHVPCFVKQLGANIVNGNYGRWTWSPRPMDRKGGDPEEWPESLRVREFPEASP